MIFVDTQKRVLLYKRDQKAPSEPGRWDLFGGTIEDGETPHDAIVREVHEELGLVHTSAFVPLIAVRALDTLSIGEMPGRYRFETNILSGE